MDLCVSKHGFRKTRRIEVWLENDFSMLENRETPALMDALLTLLRHRLLLLRRFFCLGTSPFSNREGFKKWRELNLRVSGHEQS